MFPCQAGAEAWAVLAQTHAAHRGSALQKTSGRVFTRPRRVIKKNAARSSSSPRCRCKGSRMSMYSPEAHRMQFFIRQAEVRTWLHEQAHIGMGHKRRLLCGWVSQRNGSCLGRRVFQVGLVSNPQSNSDWGDNQNRHPTDAGLGQAREVAWEAAVNAHRCRTGRHHVRQVSAEATSVRG